LQTLAAQLQMIGRDGKNPAGRPPDFTPLPPEIWTRLETILGGIEAAAGRLNALAGPDPTSGGPQGPGATRAAVNARLGHGSDTLADLRPDRLQARYGALPPPAAQELERICGELEELLGAARAAING
jgi:hypothetical protein